MALVIAILVHVLAVLQYGWAELQGREGRDLTLPSLDEVLGNGSMLVETTEFEDDDHVAFPTMKFTCSGNLTKLIFLAVPRPDVPGSGTSHFGIGMLLESNKFSIDEKLDIPDMDPIGGSGTGYELSYHPGNVSFQEGHMLALFQSSNSHHIILLQKGEMREVCRFGSDGWHTASCTNVSHRPLVAVETDHPECVNGFISRAALQYVMAATELTTHDTTESPLHFTEIRFTCDSLIKKWIVGANVTNSQQSVGQIDLIQYGPALTQQYFSLTSLNTTSYHNVYEVEVSPRKFGLRDHFIVINSSHIYYQRCGLRTQDGMSCVDRPLVAVDVDCTGHCSTCTSGFIGVDELREKARYIPNFATEYEIENLTMPFLRITQDGNITKWTFTAVENNNIIMGTEYPKLFILPPGTSEDNLPISARDDIHVYCLDSSQAIATEYPNVYELSVDPPVPVRAGDYMSISQPPSNVARMMLSFVKIPRSVRQEINFQTKFNNEYFQFQPLIHLEIDAMPPPPSCEPSETGCIEAQEDDATKTIIISAAISSTLLLIIATVVTLLIVLLCCLKRKGTVKTDVMTTTNVAYDTVKTDVMTAANVAYHTVKTDVITTANVAYDTVKTDVMTTANVAYDTVKTDVMTTTNVAYAVESRRVM